MLVRVDYPLVNLICAQRVPEDIFWDSVSFLASQCVLQSKPCKVHISIKVIGLDNLIFEIEHNVFIVHICEIVAMDSWLNQV